MLLSAATAALGGPAATGSSSSRATAALPAPRAPMRSACRSLYHSRAQPARRGPSLRAAVQAVQETHNATHGSAPITFTLSRKVDFGQQVILVGDAPELGCWDLGSAPHMTWSEGDTWTTTVDLPKGASIEYKFVLTSPNHAPVWETCDNRRVEVDPSAVSKLACDWDIDTVITEAPERARSPSPSPSGAPTHAFAPVFATSLNGDHTASASAAISNGKAAAAALSAAAAALEQKDRAAALAAVQEAASAAAAVVAAAEATAAAVAKAVQAAEALVAELDGPGGPGSPGGYKGSNGPAAAAAAQAAADAKYSAEQLDFMRRKLDAIQAMPAVSRQASPGAHLSNGSAQPATAVTPRPASPAPPAPAAHPAAGTTAFSPEQLAFLQRKSTSPPPGARSSTPAPRPRSSSPAPRPRSPPAAAPAAAAPAPAPILRPRSSSPRPRSSSPTPASRPPSAVYAPDISSYSPEQLEFLRRSGKL